MDAAKRYCKNFNRTKLVGSLCIEIYESPTGFAKQVEERKSKMFRSVEHERRNKRQLQRILPQVTKAAQMLFAFCDVNCVVSSTNNVNKLWESGSKEIKILDRRMEVIECEHYKEMEKIEKLNARLEGDEGRI